MCVTVARASEQEEPKHTVDKRVQRVYAAFGGTVRVCVQFVVHVRCQTPIDLNEEVNVYFDCTVGALCVPSEAKSLYDSPVMRLRSV